MYPISLVCIFMTGLIGFNKLFGEDMWKKCGLGASSNTCVLGFFVPYFDNNLPLLDTTCPYCSTWICNDYAVYFLAVIIVNTVSDMKDNSFSFGSTKFICFFRRLSYLHKLVGYAFYMVSVAYLK